MEALEPAETLDPLVPETLDPGAKIPAEMPPELGLGLEAEPPAAGGGGLAVGDLVWGKSRGQPWWPGRVHDPLAAPDHAKRSPRQDPNAALVAYFGGGGGFAWCNPPHVKPFFEGFDEFAGSSGSKSFRAALDSAVSEVGLILEAQLSCNCLPEEEKSKLGKCLGRTEEISNLSVNEFFGLVKDVGVDVSVGNAVEIMKLRSWVVAFERGVHVGHKRKAVSELVDKIDLDVLAAEAIDGQEILKGPEVSPDASIPGRKRRSMAALIAQMDLDVVELSDDDKEEEEKGSRKDLEAANGNAGGGVKEVVCPGRRERKKSKYLSPPYCYLSEGIARSLASPRSSEPKTPKSPRGLSSGSTVGNFSAEGVDEDGEWIDSLQGDGCDANDMLSYILGSALNHLHLNGSWFAKTARGFFSEFRSSSYSKGAKFDAYQKLLTESVGADGKIVNKEAGDKSGNNNKTAEGRGQALIVNSEGVDEDEEWIDSFQVDGLDVNDLLSDFLASSVNPLHLKWSCFAKTVRGFFSEFRRSSYSKALKFDAYQKLLTESVGADGKIVNKEAGDKSGNNNKTEEGRGQALIVNTEGVDEAEEWIDSFQVDGLDVNDLLSDSLALAVNPLHLNGSWFAKTARGFFSEFRSSSYSKGAKFDAYQKLLTEFVGADGKIVNKEAGDKSGNNDKTEEGQGQALIVNSEGWKDEGSRGRKRNDIVNVEGETLADKSEDCKETGSKSERKRNDTVNGEGLTRVDLSLQIDDDRTTSEMATLKEGTAGKVPITLKRQVAITSVDGPSGRKRGRKRKAEVNQNVILNMASQTVNHVELRTLELEQTNGDVVANGKAPSGSDIESHSQMKEATKGKKRKNNKDGLIVDVPINVGSNVTNGSGGGKSRQRKKSKNSTGHEGPAAIMVTFSPESSLPSKDDLISAFSQYGPVMQPETEVLQESSSAKIVFGRSSDAEKAYSDNLAALGMPVANYRLSYLAGNMCSPSSVAAPKPPLPYIRKSLERMISTLSGSSLENVAGTTSEGLKPETRDNLVGEMQGLLMKVDKMLTGPATGTSS